jgi:hypothetical protein
VPPIKQHGLAKVPAGAVLSPAACRTNFLHASAHLSADQLPRLHHGIADNGEFSSRGDGSALAADPLPQLAPTCRAECFVPSGKS